MRAAVRKDKSINELLAGGNKRLNALKSRSRERSLVLAHVCAALPPKFAESVASAGIEEGQLTIGVVGAAWASRLRYVTETLRKRVGESMGITIKSVRLKVVPPRSSL
jgi:hypothetical protein